MSESARHDVWREGKAYEGYMGRWSRQVAPLFLDWLKPREGLDWLEIGCGSGALTREILARNPASVLAIDRSPDFISQATRNLDDPRATFRIGDAEHLDVASESRDLVVSGLVLNFVPDRVAALAEAKRILRPGGRVGFYVWDYPNRGLEFLARFWDAAIALDPHAEDLRESRRFTFCTPHDLVSLTEQAGLVDVACEGIETQTVFRDFDDYWRPFTRGAGPAPGYCANLPEDARKRLRASLEEALPRRADGTLVFRAKAWAVTGTA
ncbi:class I SAM-dependent methyltransferase [Roseitranquillus sediminis]|uniref:class I SAM-dependent methyltransferase n=1 Tax=Roseitranquillus sediminis TaxID=2809051 RepID=UPI001D0CBD9E|nr:methyltransferase domain-containing protein [Roseitranquillus sediminis]MBM9593633.1 methyltransferase domain-containing protein [Roseitranquillus sediminis]